MIKEPIKKQKKKKKSVLFSKNANYENELLVLRLDSMLKINIFFTDICILRLQEFQLNIMKRGRWVRQEAGQQETR